MKKTAVFLVIIFATMAVLFTFHIALAQGPYLGLEYGHDTGLVAQDVRLTVARIINVALGLLGMAAVVIVIYAGFKWMTAGGNEEDVTSAKKILYAGVIGLVIILAAYSISRFVVTQIFKATTGYDYEAITGIIKKMSSRPSRRREEGSLKLFEEYREIKDAIRREKQLKNWNRNKKQMLIKSINPHWRDLSEGNG